MLKVIIADDERIIREGIANIINWNYWGFSVIALAKNGVEALELIKDNVPDIVITDIKMPLMDGLTLIKQTKKQFPDVVFVVLSGYGEFEYADKAMYEGVKHYILKPCSEKQILDAMLEVKTGIEKVRAEKEKMLSIKSNFEKVFPLAKEQFIRDFIVYKSYSKDEFGYFINLFSINPEQKLQLILLEPEDKMNYENLWSITRDIENFMSEEIIFFKTVIKNYILIVVKETEQDSLNLKIKQIQENIYSQFELKTAVSFVFSKDFNCLPLMYKRAVEYLNYSIYLGRDAIITDDIISEEVANVSLTLPDYCFDEISYLVKSGHIDRLNYSLVSFFDTIEHLKNNNVLYKTYCMELLITIVRLVEEELLDKYFRTVVNLITQESTELMKNYVLEIANILAQKKHDYIIKKNSTLVSKIIDYVINNFKKEELSLKWIAQNIIFMNVGYASKVFQKETGEKFSVYLTKIRMEEAKRLIEISFDEKIYDVAENIGMGNNPQYFSQVFKKYTGYSPSEYRKNINKNIVITVE